MKTLDTQRRGFKVGEGRKTSLREVQRHEGKHSLIQIFSLDLPTVHKSKGEESQVIHSLPFIKATTVVSV